MSIYEYINVHVCVCVWECACENVYDWECMSLAVWMYVRVYVSVLFMVWVAVCI